MQKLIRQFQQYGNKKRYGTLTSIGVLIYFGTERTLKRLLNDLNQPMQLHLEGEVESLPCVVLFC